MDHEDAPFEGGEPDEPYEDVDPLGADYNRDICPQNPADGTGDVDDNADPIGEDDNNEGPGDALNEASPAQDSAQMSEALDPRRLLNEARSEALRARNPLPRLKMCTLLVADGQSDVAPHAFAAVQEMGQPPISEEISRLDQILSREDLAKAFVQAGSIEDAERVLQELDAITLDRGSHRLHLLREGYLGANEAVVKERLSMHLEDARTNGYPVHPEVFHYLGLLAEQGKDLLAIDTEEGKLLFDAVATQDDDLRDNRFQNIAVAYARGGHFDKAVTFKELTRNSHERLTACHMIAEAAAEQGNFELASQLVDEAKNSFDAVTWEPGWQDAGLTAIPKMEIAAVLAKLGRVEEAREAVAEAQQLVGNAVNSQDQRSQLTDVQAKTYVSLYEVTGEDNDRAQVLLSVADDPRNQATSEVIQRIAEADRRYGRMIQPGEAAERIPQICWEIHGLYANKTSTERWLDAGIREEEREWFESMGYPVERLSYEWSQIRVETRDRALADLAPIVARSGAPITARKIIDSIQTRTERVRAMIGVSHALS